ncbi:MAG TPA: aminotransferase class V-fold PLP-dependent enzyme, partial [Spirochaetes bacterium]|nr:aminotransferase class V-fold PLP-dependent enzyme [Spirochaetota bacterium]
MDYTPHTAHDIQSMLEEIGLSSIEGLFKHLPKELLDPDIDLNKGLSEFEVMSAVQKLARKNTSVTDCPSFLGGGLYDHYIPPAVDAIANRSEFYTAYTPYQPEASQGALQAMIEYQTAIAKLTQMDIANASLYDGSSALAEAVLMAVEITGKSEIIVSDTIHPEWLEVLDTYLSGRDIHVKTIPNLGGESDFSQIKSLISDDTACLCIANPNFFGVIEDYRDIKKELEAHKALLVVATNPFSLGFLEPPGTWGADI